MNLRVEGQLLKKETDFDQEINLNLRNKPTN